MTKEYRTRAAGQLFLTAGRPITEIAVRISYRIIQLFSEGLYSSPNKAIEELTANAFDAGASHVHVIISPDLVAKHATITVVDDGEGMDATGLDRHWVIGVSDKRKEDFEAPKSRRQIGKFGIGKLATFVLAGRLTHITKASGKFFAASMDFSKIPSGTGGGIYTEELVTIPLRELSESEAKGTVNPWINGEKEGYQALKLFGSEARKTWTVAIMSDLKDMARQIRLGRLKWVLSTGMPLGDDFELYLNGDRIKPAKLKGKRIDSWTLGRNLTELPKPAPDDLQPTEDEGEGRRSYRRFGLTHSELGRVTGHAVLYEDLLTGGKAEKTGRSHGFFVYVHGRLVNVDDEYFGIDSNRLRHGTFSRFRCEANIDRLDEELRSSRESVRETSLVQIARNILEGVFNTARSRHQAFENEKDTGLQAVRRVAASPNSLARRPITGLVQSAIKGQITPQYTSYPKALEPAQKATFVEQLEERASSPEGLVLNVELAPLSSVDGVALYESETGVLKINTLHPFVAYFLDEFEDKRTNLPLELIAVSEVLLEARLYELGLPENQVRDTLTHRDELLRYLARSTGRRNALMVANDLMDAATDKDALETELVAAFDSMGFEAVPLGGKGRPDGYAEANLSADAQGNRRSFKVSLEAKSKRRPGAVVTAKSVGISTVARQRDDERYGCDHAIVVGPDFPTRQREKSALATEIAANRKNTGKTITLIRISDLARLVRMVPAKRIGLDRIRDLFQTCVTPEDSERWVDKVATEMAAAAPYREVLEAIADEQKDVQDKVVRYSNVETHLRLRKGIRLREEEVIELCRALSKMAEGYVFARQSTVEINTRPDRILEAIRATIHQYPEEELRTILRANTASESKR